MTVTLQALSPILLLIILGYLLRRYHFIPKDIWAGLEKLVYFILFPALLVHTLATRSFDGLPWLELGSVVVITLLAAAGLLTLIQSFRPMNKATFTSVFQGGVRFNNYITLAVAQSLMGAEGLLLGSVVSGFIIILVNVLCISAFIIWGDKPYQGIRPLFLQILRNPLIIACLIGFSLNLSGFRLSGVPAETLAILSRAALPLGLLSVGAALQLAQLHKHLPALGIASIVQFGFKPAMVFTLVATMGLEGAAAGALLIAFTTPTAPSAYILSRQLGGDSEAMAAIITLQTLLAFVMMPLLLGWHF